MVLHMIDEIIENYTELDPALVDADEMAQSMIDELETCN